MRTIAIAMLSLLAMNIAAQVRHIAPTEAYKLPTDAVLAEFDRLGAASQSRELTSAEAQRMEQIVDDNAVLDDLYSGKCSWYCGGVVDTVTATSSLPPAGKNTYIGQNAHNFDHTSVWAEGADGSGIGESLTYEFAGGCPRITMVKILNGHVKNEKAWRENNRVKSLRVWYENKPLAILDLKDTRDLQCFEVGTLGYHDSEAPKWQLRFEILDVYKGSKYDDTVISELFFDGIDVH
ncbi:MAG: hypothetical protein IJ613_10435 [Muribaculaceae bacterium]|nr:hypothetical protein [Muribaculaceae bacterium]